MRRRFAAVLLGVGPFSNLTIAAVGQHFVITVIVRERGADFWSGGLARAYRKLSQRLRRLLI